MATTRDWKKPAVLLCPVCGHRLTPNKGWVAQFYDGYCNRCDMPVKHAVATPRPQKRGCENAMPQGTIEDSAQNEKYMWLNNAVLQINPAIQRKISPMRVDAIVRHFSPNVANPIKVSFRDGKYYIFDGMHTREALCILNGTDDFPIFCRVYYGLTVEDEARLFAAQFGFSEAVSMGYRLRALAVAKDPEVLDFLKVTKESGLNIYLGSHTGRNGNIAATCAAFKAYRALGSAEYGRMLTMLHRTWAGESWSINRYMISGMARFMKMYEVSTPAFVKAFREVTYAEIVMEAARFAGMSKDGAFAAAFADIYDRNSQYPLKETA